MAGGKKNKIVINKADFKKNPALVENLVTTRGSDRQIQWDELAARLGSHCENIIPLTPTQR